MRRTPKIKGETTIAQRKKKKKTRAKPDRLSPRDLLALVETSLDDDKAGDVTVIDLAGKTEFADFMVIATGGSRRNISAMANHLLSKLKSSGMKSVPVEGLTQGDWVLIDSGDIIVHLFRAEIREFYDLEKIWGGPVRQPGEAA